MFHVGRCGSTVLTEMLAQHPAIYWDGETFARVEDQARRQEVELGRCGVDPRCYVNARLARAGARYFGFDAKFRQVHQLGVSTEALLTSLPRSEPHLVVSLRRRNLLRQLVSALNGQRRHAYHNRSGDLPQLAPLRLDLASWGEGGLPARFDSLNAAYADLESLHERYRILHLEYERDIEQDPTVACELVVDGLGLDAHPASATLRRSNPEPLDLLVDNLDEVRSHLAGTSHAWMIEE